jgi:hypothetical protein
MCETGRFISLLTFVVFATGCSTWRPVRVVPPAPGQGGPAVVALDDGREVHPSRVRILPSGGPEVLLEAPQVEGDTLRGLVGSQTVSFALADVRVLEMKQVSKVRTVGAVLVGIPLILLGTLIATCGDACR